MHRDGSLDDVKTHALIFFNKITYSSTVADKLVLVNSILIK